MTQNANVKSFRGIKCLNLLRKLAIKDELQIKKFTKPTLVKMYMYYYSLDG